MTQLTRSKREMRGFDVFISYSTRNKHTADAMKQHLQAKGIRCWKAPDDILPGEKWASAISRAIKTAPVMVLIWTKESMQSGQVVNELTLADRSRRLVIPFRTEQIEPEEEFEYYLAKTHWLDAFSDNLSEDLDLLARRIKANLPQEESGQDSLGCHSGTFDNTEQSATELIDSVSSEDDLLAECRLGKVWTSSC